MKKEWSDEFLAYARTNGKTPEEQIKLDEQNWPGGIMAGFILWMGEALRIYKHKYPRMFIGDQIKDQEHKNAFLQQLANGNIVLH